MAALFVVAGSQAAPTRATAGEPQSLSPPTIAGSPVLGQNLTASGGTWSSATPITSLKFQWWRCQSSGLGCSNISGATASTYTVASADLGNTIRVAQIATNSAGSTTAPSAPTAVVTQHAPVNTGLPTISGSAAVGQKLTANGGTWSSPTPITSLKFQWWRCQSSGLGCSNINGATAGTYTVATGDVGNTIRVAQIATNAAGSTTAASKPTAVVPQSGPVSSREPTISGTLEAGKTVSTNGGQWSSPTPITSLKYQWLRCDGVGNNCSAINGATSSSYKIANGDVAHTLRVTQTATNSTGTGSTTSNPSGLVAPAGGKALATSPPAITGNTVVGSTLSTKGAQWFTTRKITSSRFQWQRCNAAGKGCQSIPGAVSTSYGLVSQDAGHTIRVTQTVDNGRGAVSSTSGQTRVVTSPAGTVPAGSIAAQNVRLPNRLVISGVKFTPSSLNSRNTFVARFRVTDTSGRPVSGALVYALGLPYSWVQKGVELSTGQDGWATLPITPTRKMPLGRGHAIVIFVRARVPGQAVLAGSSARRLVQVRIG